MFNGISDFVAYLIPKPSLVTQKPHTKVTNISKNEFYVGELSVTGFVE